MKRRFVLPTLSVLTVTVAPQALAAQQLWFGRAHFGSPNLCHAAGRGLVQVRLDPPPKGGELGPLTACDSSGVTFGSYAGEPGDRVVPAVRILDLAVRVRSGARGAIVGGLLGGVAGFGFSIVHTQPCASGAFSPPNNCPGNVLASTIVGLAGGIGIGWFFGRGLTHWKVLYRAYES